MMKPYWIIRLFFFLILGFSVQSGTVLADPISIQSAQWGYGNHWCNVTDHISRSCNGKDSCGDRAMLASFPCGDPSFGNVKILEIKYSCRNNSMTTHSREYLNWKLSCPPEEQPNALAEFRITRGKSCNSENGSETVLLPEGYRYCWHSKADFSSNGATDSTARVIGTGPRNGIVVDWKVGPEGFPCPSPFGRGWIDHLWIVVGARPDCECPPNH